MRHSKSLTRLEARITDSRMRSLLQDCRKEARDLVAECDGRKPSDDFLAYITIRLFHDILGHCIAENAPPPVLRTD